MKHSEGPDESPELTEIRRHVRMEHLLISYDHLTDHMMAVCTSRLQPDFFDSLKLKREPFIIIVPSPFAVPDGMIDRVRGDLNLVIVCLDNNVWEHSLGLRPSNVPNDIFGFVMAYERCSYQDAVEKLSALATEIRQNKNSASEIAEIREFVRFCAERTATLFEASKIRERLVQRLKN